VDEIGKNQQAQTKMGIQQISAGRRLGPAWQN
jgi:hypothetical protein